MRARDRPVGLCARSARLPASWTSSGRRCRQRTVDGPFVVIFVVASQRRHVAPAVTTAAVQPELSGDRVHDVVALASIDVRTRRRGVHRDLPARKVVALTDAYQEGGDGGPPRWQGLRRRSWRGQGVLTHLRCRASARALNRGLTARHESRGCLRANRGPYLARCTCCAP